MCTFNSWEKDCMFELKYAGQSNVGKVHSWPTFQLKIAFRGKR